MNDDQALFQLKLAPTGLRFMHTLKREEEPAGLSKRSPAPSCSVNNLTPNENKKFQPREMSYGVMKLPQVLFRLMQLRPQSDFFTLDTPHLLRSLKVEERTPFLWSASTSQTVTDSARIVEGAMTSDGNVNSVYFASG